MSDHEPRRPGDGGRLDAKSKHEASNQAKIAAMRRSMRPVVPISAKMGTSEILAVIAGLGLYALLLVEMIAWGNPGGASVIHPVFPLASLIFFLYPFRHHLVSRRLIQLSIVSFLVWLGINLSGVLFPFIIAFLIAYISSGVVDRLDARGLPRWVAALGVVLIILGVYAAVAVWVIPAMIGQMDQMVNAAQRLIQDAGSMLEKDTLVRYLTELGISEQQAETIVVDNLEPQVRAVAEGVVGWIGDFLKNLALVIEGVVSLVLIPFLTFYLLLDFNRIRVFVRSTLLQDNPEYVYYVGRVDTILASYLGGILITSSIVGVLAIISLSVLQIPYAIVLGVLIGVLNLIPTFGILINILIAMVLFIFAPGDYLYNVGITFIVINVLHALNGYVIEPRIVGERVGLHPVMVMASLLAFSHFLGFVGLLIAVPVTAVALMFLREWYQRSLALDRPVHELQDVDEEDDAGTIRRAET